MSKGGHHSANGKGWAATYGICQMGNERNTGCLGYIGDCTTQLCGDYIMRIPIKQPV